jgi:LemA protein
LEGPGGELDMLYITAVLILLAVLFDVIYYRLVRARNLVREAWSGIDVQLKRRHDLIPNLIETVKGYRGYEQSVLEQITATRAKTSQAQSPGDRADAENALTQGFKTIFAVAEAYPDLKANTSFLELQKNLVDIENQIQYARRYYNGTVRDMNILVESFPSNLVAAFFKFRTLPFFQIELATVRDAPEVNLS